MARQDIFMRTPGKDGFVPWGHERGRSVVGANVERLAGTAAIIGTTQDHLRFGATHFKPDMPIRHVIPDVEIVS